MVEAKKSECESYLILKTLGSGTFGVVKKAEEKSTKNLAALKILMLNDYSEEFAKEAAILELLNHKNVIKVFKVIPKAEYKKKNGTILERDVIAMEFAESGSLFDHLFAAIQLHKRGFTEPTIRRLFHQMVDALEYCHKSKVVHRDLKPENVLLDAEFNVKLADFGIATIADKQKHLTISGTEGYQAPEMLSQKGHELEPTDIFVLGVMLFMMKAGHPPFEDASPGDSIYKWFYQGKVENFWKGMSAVKMKAFGKDFYSEDFKELCSGLLHPDPALRYKFEDIRASKWYNGEVADKEAVLREFTTYLEKMNELAEKEKKEREAKLACSVKIGGGKGEATFQGITPYRGETAGSVEDQLKRFGISFGEKKREITTKPKGKSQTVYEIVSGNLELLFQCLMLAAVSVCEKIDINEKKYKITGKFSLPTSKLENYEEENSSEDEVSGRISITLYRTGARDDEYIISFKKIEGNYFRFLQFVENVFMKEFKKLPW